MTSAQVYASVQDFDDQFKGSKKESVILHAILDASDFIVLQPNLGKFIPYTATVKLRGPGLSSQLRSVFVNAPGTRLFIPPLLSITSIQNSGVVLSSVDYQLQPDGGHWENGPYSWLMVDPDSNLISVWDNSSDDAVQITGLWGKYNKSEATGATVADTTQQDASQTTIKSSDGSKLSPGMVLYIGSEQESITSTADPTTAITTLGAALDNSSEIITLATGGGALLKAGEIIRSEFEQMKIREIQSDQASVYRGWNATSKAAHASGKNVDVYRTFNVTRAVNGTTAAVHTNGAAISKYTTPMNYLCVQIATLMLNKASTGYSGKGGNTDTGEVFYYGEFPQKVIDEISDNYYIPRTFA